MQSRSLFYIKDIKTDIIRSKSLQLKAYYLTKAEYDKKEEEKNRERQQNLTYCYLNGDNAKVNNNSTDQSINIVNTNSEDLFGNIRKVLKEHLAEEER
ncbi:MULTISPECIES: hypothetical protein [Priestia]|uniref:hypothetical protein n=1 Tax=Priestia TaxID=2800373 RepID=UPI0018A25E3B|nr:MULTISPECIES: hypothetical protein [Priestia]QTL51774.1 hypothetical protein J5Z55_12115 [Priestia aryabhattai]